MYEDGRSERQREDQGERHCLGGLGIRCGESHVGEAPRKAVGEEQHEKAGLHYCHDAAVRAKADEKPDAGDDHHDEDVACQVRDGASAKYRHARHRECPEPFDETALEVFGEADGGTNRTEDRGLDQDSRDQVIDVVDAGYVNLSAKDVAEEQHEHDGLNDGEDQCRRDAKEGQQVPTRHGQDVAHRPSQRAALRVCRNRCRTHERTFRARRARGEPSSGVASASSAL